MKLLRRQRRKYAGRGGFSLVEATFSLGLLSCGVLTLAPLLGLGLKTSRSARTDSTTSEIALTLGEEARQGTLPTGTLYFDESGAPCTTAPAAYSALAATDSPAANVTRVTLRVTPLGAPDRVRIYAVLFATQD
jgi:Tfp pilus assembly protein PilV